MLFKKIQAYRNKDFNFELTFPEHFWKYKRFSKNEIWFLNTKNNEAIILYIYNDKDYVLDEEMSLVRNYERLVLGDIDSIVYYKLFEADKLTQYEWVFIKKKTKYRFAYTVVQEKDKLALEEDYRVVVEILNSIVFVDNVGNGSE